jgi:tetratricopeptide (TPR) repeat protein
MADRFDQYFMLQTQAKKMEQTGNNAKAIALYTEIISDYQPYDDFPYDRLSILLEKNHSISESIIVCEKAMEKIKNSDIKGDSAKFEDRIKRLTSKVQETASTTKVSREKEVVDLHMPLLKEMKGIKALLSLCLYAGAFAFSVPNHWLRFVVIILFFGFLDYLFYALLKMAQSKRALITFSIALVFLIATVFASLQLPEIKELIELKENTQATESETIVKESAGIIIEDTDTPLIDEALLEKARKTIELEPAYDKCALSATANTIDVNLTVKASTSSEEAERIFKKLAKNISALASQKGTTAPSGSQYGSLYETYTLNFMATDTFDTPVLSGSLFKNKFTIR